MTIYNGVSRLSILLSTFKNHSAKSAEKCTTYVDELKIELYLSTLVSLHIIKYDGYVYEKNNRPISYNQLI